MHRSISAFLATAAVVMPVGTAWGAARPATMPGVAAPHKKSSPPHKSMPSARATNTRKIAGPVEDMQWGPVQVTLTVKGKKIIDVQASAPTERPRSAFINEQAIPMLRQEVLKAQSARIDGISGATMTSYAFYYSLVAALKKAHL